MEFKKKSGVEKRARCLQRISLALSYAPKTTEIPQNEDESDEAFKAIDCISTFFYLCRQSDLPKLRNYDAHFTSSL
jgi:hypothetical protein